MNTQTPPQLEQWLYRLNYETYSENTELLTGSYVGAGELLEIAADDSYANQFTRFQAQRIVLIAKNFDPECELGFSSIFISIDSRLFTGNIDIREEKKLSLSKSRLIY